MPSLMSVSFHSSEKVIPRGARLLLPSTSLKQVAVFFYIYQTPYPSTFLKVIPQGASLLLPSTPLNPSNAEATFVQSTRMQRLMKTI